jgi:predicted transcriptional regulator of viral defense system
MADSRRASGLWLPLDHGVYGLAASPPSWLRQLKAAELRFERGAISGRSAAALHGLAEIGPCAIEVTVPRNGGRTSRLGRVRQRDGVSTTSIAGIRVVTVEQAVADMAALPDVRLAERAFDDALLLNKSTPERVAALARDLVHRRMKGSGRFASLADDRLAGYLPPANVLERALYELLDDPDAPRVRASTPRRVGPGRP